MTSMEELAPNVQALEAWLESEGIEIRVPKHVRGEKWRVSLVADVPSVSGLIEEEVVGDGDSLPAAILDAFDQWQKRAR
jgi:hypothetical protein